MEGKAGFLVFPNMLLAVDRIRNVEEWDDGVRIVGAEGDFWGGREAWTVPNTTVAEVLACIEDAKRTQ